MNFVRTQTRSERFRGCATLLSLGALIALAGSAAAQTEGIPQSQNFGSVAVGSSSAQITLSYTPSGLTAAPSFSLSYGLEFTVTTPSCTSSGTITCTIGVKLSPRSPGVREDALVVRDHSGNFLGITYLYGSGSGPQISVTPGIITTIAGTRSFGYSGDGQPATSATLWNPSGLAVDSAGNVYIADSINQVIRKITASNGLISTVAGIGDSPGYSGDGAAATSAKLNNPTGVAVDGAGNLYIADQANNAIRQVTAATGIITTVAGGGNGNSGTDSYGDGGPATAAVLSGPNDVAVDAVGNLYIADSWHSLVRKVTASTGLITVVAGGGSGGGSDAIGDGGAAVNATLNNPSGVAVDANGNVFIADTGNCMIRRVDNTSGIITAVAGTGNPGYWGDLGPATSAEFQSPTGVRVDSSGNLYIVDYGANVLREVSSSTGVINTIAGTGNSGDSGDNGTATNASIDAPANLALDAAGNIYLVDSANNVVRKVSIGASALAFAAVNIGQAGGAQLLTVSNIGTQRLQLSAVSVPANFQQQTSGYTDCYATASVLSGAACFIALDFVPTTAGVLTGTLTVTSNSLNHSGTSVTASLTGTGNSGPVPRVSINPSILSFGNQNVGVSSASKIVTLSNTGTATLNILSIWLLGVSSTDFGLSTTCGGTLAANASCTVTVTFVPGAAGARSASLMFTDSVANSPQSVPLGGTGVQPPPPPAAVSLSSASLAFPAQNVGNTSAPLSITLTNSGGVALGISGIALSGTNPADFSMSTTCGAMLAAGASCTVAVTFSPSSGGIRSATLSFSDTASNTPQTVSLFGTGNALSLTQVPGALAQISVGADGSVWGLNSGGQIFNYSANQGWVYIPGTLAHITAGSASAVWGLNASQLIFSWASSSVTWDYIPGTLTQIAIGSDGDVWGLNASQSVYHYDSVNQKWQQIPGTLAKIAVGSDGEVWGINPSNSVFRFNAAARTFGQIPGSLTQIAVGADGDVWGLENQSILHFSPLSQTFTSMAGSLSQITVGSGGNVYGLNSQNQVCQYNAQSQSCSWIAGNLTQIAASANGSFWGLDSSGNIWTLNKAVQPSGIFHQLPATLSQLSVAADGAAWALNTAGSIFCFDPSLQQWTQIPGALAQIAIAPGGVVWGLNSSGMIFRFTPSTQSWAYVPGGLSQIAVGSNGDVWGLNSSGMIFRFAPSTQSWTYIPGTLTQLSIGSDGTVWGLNSAGNSYRYNSNANTWQQYAGTFSQIAVGSSANVWALDANGRIYRFNSQSGAWTSVAGTLAQISVGFDGAVWGVNSSRQVFRFNPQASGWDQISGSLARVAVASDAVVWGLDSSGSPYRFQ